MSRGRRRVVRIEVEHRFGVSVREGFDYITELTNWPAYWPRFVRLDPGSRWRDPGDRARLTLQMLAREVELEMTLARFESCRVVAYTSRQRGLPAARHWRHFQPTDGGFAYRIVIEYFPRAGWRGLLDRTLVRARDHGHRLRDHAQSRSPIPRKALDLRSGDPRSGSPKSQHPAQRVRVANGREARPRA